nr:DUF6622 family protein [Massilia varians]
MLQQILIKTPVYVWAILAFLVYRGVLAAREREMTLTRMAIVPVVMLVLALHAIAAQFGMASVAMPAWLLGAAVLTLQRLAFGRSCVLAVAGAGRVRLRGSWAPLALMLTVFSIKYVLAVVLAILPGMAGQAVFVATVCFLLGLCNGYFLGQLARDIASARRIPHERQLKAYLS